MKILKTIITSKIMQLIFDALTNERNQEKN